MKRFRIFSPLVSYKCEFLIYKYKISLIVLLMEYFVLFFHYAAVRWFEVIWRDFFVSFEVILAISFIGIETTGWNPRQKIISIN